MTVAQVENYLAKCKPGDYIYCDFPERSYIIGQLTTV
jgi:hypothetical protein